MGRKPATSRDRMLLRLKMIVVALTAGVTVQQRMLRDAFILDGDPNDDDGFVWNLMHSQLMLAGQVAVLPPRSSPFFAQRHATKSGRRSILSSGWRGSFEFGDSTSCDSRPSGSEHRTSGGSMRGYDSQASCRRARVRLRRTEL